MTIVTTAVTTNVTTLGLLMDAPKPIKRLTWEDYPEPRLIFLRGKFVVEVSIPRSIRKLFGSGKGTTTNRRLSTGTSDIGLAKRKKLSLANEIYREFDKKQDEALQIENNRMDTFALDVISDLAQAFNYNRGEIPSLDPSTDYDELVKMKNTLDGYYQMMIDQVPAENQIKIALESMVSGIQNGDDRSEIIKQLSNNLTNGSHFSMHQNGLISRHSSTVVQSYWQDLLTVAAEKQGKTSPIFNDAAFAEVAQVDGTFLPAVFASRDEKIERPRRVLSSGTLTISSLKDEYFSEVERDYVKANTKNKLKRGVDRFLKLMGDYPLQEVKPALAYRYADAQLDENPNASNSSISDYHWGMSKFFKFCVQRGHIDVNPFVGVDLTKRGEETRNWLSYTRSELAQIFSYNWSTQERLLLTLLATTGMRLSEAGCLTWERFNDTEEKGIRYFSLIDTNEETVDVKNQGSKRFIPLHPEIILPPKSQGRLFNYTIDDNGLCSTSAGNKLNPTLSKIVPHDRKSTHSFRGTLKIMLRDCGVSREINNIITGHGEGDTAGSAYGGASLATRFDAISKLDLSWLKQN